MYDVEISIQNNDNPKIYYKSEYVGELINKNLKKVIEKIWIAGTNNIFACYNEER